MDTDVTFAILEIDIEEVKNDLPYRIHADCGITIHPRLGNEAFYDAILKELEDLGANDG